MALKKLFWTGFFSFFSLGLLCLFFSADFMTDSAHYLWGARSLAQGLGYRTYNPVAAGTVPINSWPPLFSALIAFFMRFFHAGEITAFKITNLLAWTLYAASCLGLLFSAVKTLRFRLLGLIFMFVPVVWRYLNLMMSEMLFMALLALSFFLCFKASEAAPGAKRSGLLIASGTAVLLLGLTRYSGFVAAIPFGLFLFIFQPAPRSFSKKAKDVLLFLLPVILGLGAWIIRNKFVTGHFTFLETHNKWPRQYHSLLFDLHFLRAVFEGLMGYRSASWPFPSLTYLPAGLFFLLMGSLALRQKPDARGKFFLQTSIFFVFYLAELFLLKLKKGFGDSSRYFHVISPFIYLACLGALEQLLEVKEKSKWRRVSAGALALFLTAVFLLKGFDSLRAVVNTPRRVTGVVPGISLPDFEHSTWIYPLIRETVTEKDILVSNNAEAIGYGTGHQCLNYRSLHAQGLDGDQLKNPSGDVFLAIEKKYALNPTAKPNFRGFLDPYQYEILREDDHAILVRLLPSEAPHA